LYSHWKKSKHDLNYRQIALILNTINFNFLVNMAKCPYCNEVIDLSQMKTVEFEDGDLLFKFLGLSCPNCEKLLKIQKID
jgi:uncharacterized protein with PIN domain